MILFQNQVESLYQMNLVKAFYLLLSIVLLLTLTLICVIMYMLNFNVLMRCIASIKHILLLDLKRLINAYY